ncbi:MAG: hypothetical protein II757_05840 [Bacteroidales bacterium]|nr:hypothetical protein [Bacteroidales bacterium]
MKLIAASDAVTPLERDLALQLLREAYLIVMDPDVAQPEPVVEVKPVAQPEPVVEVKPVAQPEPVVEVKPVVQPKPVVEVKPVAQPEPVVEAKPVVQPEPVAEVKPVAQPEPKESHPMDDDILDFLGAPSTPVSPQEPAPAPKAEPVRAPQPAPVHEVKPQPAPVEEPQHSEPAPKPAPAVTQVEPQPRPKSPSTLFSEPTPTPTPARKETKTLHDILAQTHEDNSLATKFQHSHIDDLSKAITLNDKFIYIRELFRNKGEEFGQAIQKLNNCQNIDEAFSEIDMMKKFYMWDTTSTAYLSLCDLVRRKFV